MADDSQEDIFSNDIDPLDGIRQLRKEEEASAENEESAVDDEVEEELVEEEEELEVESSSADEGNDGDVVDDQVEGNPASEEETGSDEKEKEPSKTEESEPVNYDDDESVKGYLNQTRKVKANGKEYEFTVQEIVDKFDVVFGQSVDYTQKTQKIAPYRKMISAMEEEKITPEQFNVAISALKGDKGALKKLMDDHKIDSYDLATDEAAGEYQAKEYGSDEITIQLREVVDEISKDDEYLTTVDVLQNSWDTSSQEAIANNPAYLQGLHNDVKSGLYKELEPIASKMKILDGSAKSDIEYYMLAGQQRSQQMNSRKESPSVDELNEKTQAKIANSGKASSEADKKRAASTARTRSDRTVTDYLDDNDENYDEWYKNLMSSQ